MKHKPNDFYHYPDHTSLLNKTSDVTGAILHLCALYDFNTRRLLSYSYLSEENVTFFNDLQQLKKRNLQWVKVSEELHDLEVLCLSPSVIRHYFGE